MPPLPTEFVSREDRDGIATITMSRPEKLNALSTTLMRQLSDALTLVDRDDSVKVVVLRGTEKAFSVGYDIA